MSREDEMRKGAEVIQRHLREPSSDSGDECKHHYNHGQKTLAGVPRVGARKDLDMEDEIARLTRLRKVREWETSGHLTMVPFYSIQRGYHALGEMRARDIGMQAVRVGGVFFEEPEDLFPSEPMFANIALAVKAGVTEEGQDPIFSMKLPGGKK